MAAAAVWLGADPQLASKLLGVLSGLRLALASVCFCRQSGRRKGELVVLVGALLLAVHMLPVNVSPDLPLALLAIVLVSFGLRALTRFDL